MPRLIWTPEMDREAVELLGAAESQYAAWQDWQRKETARRSVGYETFRSRARRLRDREQPANDVVANDTRPEAPLTSAEPFMVFSDTHAPDHDKAATALTLRVAHDLRPKFAVHIGDLFNGASVSSHQRYDDDDPKLLSDELRSAEEFVEQLSAIPGCKMTITLGNHDMWLQRRVHEKLPGLVGMVSIDKALRLSERGWNVRPYREPHMIGDTMFVHDQEHCGVRAHEQVLAKAGANIVMGHTHVLAITYRGTLIGRRMFGASVGHLASEHATRHLTRTTDRHTHQLGFATGVLTASGQIHMNLHPIIVTPGAYSCVVNGKEYRIETQHPRSVA